jgi:glucose-6-phosphate 1-dehydrogenase
MGRADIKRDTVRGQYKGYRGEKGVDARSGTETYFRITAFLKPSRWRGVPIAFESGKKIAKTFAEVEVTFRGPEDGLCSAVGGGGCVNVLRYEIQPDEKMSLSFWFKRPGTDMVVEEREFKFDYKALYSSDDFVDSHVDPYKKLLSDVIAGNQTRFVSTDEIKASWKFIDPIVRAWKKDAVPLVPYEPGSMPENSV